MPSSDEIPERRHRQLRVEGQNTEKRGSASDRVVHYSRFMVPPSSNEPIRSMPEKPKITLDDCRKMENGFCGATATNGVFRLAHLADRRDQDQKWPNRLVEDRDCSDLRGQIAKEVVTPLTETVVDGTFYTLQNKSEVKAHYRTSTLHVCSGGKDRLLGIRRRDERGDGDTSSLCAATLQEATELANQHEIALASAPLLGLDPELAYAPERRVLIRRGFSYALRVHPEFLFDHVSWNLEDALDVWESLPVKYIFDMRWPDRDRAKSSMVAVRDLRDPRHGSTGRFLEHLVEVPYPGDEPLYFVTRAALPPSSGERDRVRRAAALASRAAERVGQTPAELLRVHEFHHHDEERYYNVLRMVERARSAA